MINVNLLSSQLPSFWGEPSFSWFQDSKTLPVTFDSFFFIYNHSPNLPALPWNILEFSSFPIPFTTLKDFHFFVPELLQKVLLPKARFPPHPQFIIHAFVIHLLRHSITFFLLGPYSRTYNGSLLFSELSSQIRNLGCK